MMKIATLNIENIRIIGSEQISFSEKFNVFCGNNGEGKTSFLEAIYFLGNGQTFRGQQILNLVAFGKEKCLVSGKIIKQQVATQLGIERYSNNKEQKIKIAGSLATRTDLIRCLPLQIINSETFYVLLGPAKHRRKLLDWGTLQREQNYLSIWRKYKKALLQRNAGLKMHNYSYGYWEQLLDKYGQLLHQMRVKYFLKFKPILFALLKELLPGWQNKINISYLQGWPKDDSLLDILQRSLQQDKRRGATIYGAHRCDFEFKVNNINIKDIFSRGQMKMFVCAIVLAQLQMYTEESLQTGIILIDDLASELDYCSMNKIIKILRSMTVQVFATAIDPGFLEKAFSDNEASVFHVEHGKIAKRSMLQLVK